MRISAGLLLFRKNNNGFEFFLVHPGGPFYTKKNEGVWSVPKGELDGDEEPLKAAVREFEEETGKTVTGNFIPLNPIIQKGGKKVLCWAVEGDFDPSTLVSNTFEMEWPPKSGKMQDFVEIDRGDWFDYQKACIAIKDRQIPLLDELRNLLKLSE